MQNIHLNTTATQRRTLWIGLVALACVSTLMGLSPLKRAASGPATLPSMQPRFAQAEPASHATFAPTRMRSGGREIAGFSARLPRPAKMEALTPPAGLKPAETEAWLAMAQRQDAATKQTLESFYPARYGEPFIVEGAGVRVAVRPVGCAAVAAAPATLEDGKVIYREAYPATDSRHVVTEGRSEEFLYLHSAAAPDEFEYEISEMSASTQIKLVDGEVRFTNPTGQGVKIEAPWVQTPDGTRCTDVVRWELADAAPDQAPRLWLKVTAEGLQYPLVIDPSWATTGSLAARYNHTATLLPNGQVLVAGATMSASIPVLARNSKIRRRGRGRPPAA